MYNLEQVMQKSTKFKVGDLVIGNESNGYSITSKGVVCEVVEVFLERLESGDDIKVVTTADPEDTCPYEVRSERFDLYKAKEEEFDIQSVAPEGFKVVDFRTPEEGEWYIDLSGEPVEAVFLRCRTSVRLILEKIKTKQDLEIEELEATIQKAQEQIQQLKEGK